MAWLVWRQYRLQAAVVAALLVAFAVLVLVTGLGVAAQLRALLAPCGGTVAACGDQVSGLSVGSAAVGFLIIMTLGVPVLPGLFFGAPLVAHELETGTNQFVWMQSITRRRWLARKAAAILLAAAVLSGAVSALVTWWERPDNALQLNAFALGRFDITGIVPVGYALFAVALGIFAGALFRRTLPALAATLAVFIAVRSVVAEFVRPHYLAAVTAFYGMGSSGHPAGAYWQLSQGFVGPHGPLVIPQTTNDPVYDGVPANLLSSSCRAMLRSGDLSVLGRCLDAAGFRRSITYQPADRFWPFQSIETGIFVALAALLIAATFAIVQRRDA